MKQVRDRIPELVAGQPGAFRQATETEFARSLRDNLVRCWRR
jgi:hypothetical protein